MDMDILESMTRESCGRVMKQIRERFGNLSVSDLAKVLGVSRSTIMRIEDGRTLPSDDFLNRLKALQVIGISKFKLLSEKNKIRFAEALEEIGENPRKIQAGLAAQALKELTPLGILAGLGSIGGASLAAGSGLIASVPTVTGLAGYGLIKGLLGIVKANDLTCTEVDGRWEIIKKQQKEEQDNG